MTFTTYNRTDGMFAIHRTGCADTRRPQFEFENTNIGTYNTVREAVNGILDDDIIEMGYGVESVDALPCCKAAAADFADRAKPCDCAQHPAMHDSVGICNNWEAHDGGRPCEHSAVVS